MGKNPKKKILGQAGKQGNYLKTNSENSRSQIVFRTDIFRKDVSRYPAAGKCFQKTRYPAVRNFDQKQCLKSLECSKQLLGVFTQSK